MKPFSLTRTFLLFCAVCFIGAIVLGSMASHGIEKIGWIGLVVCIVLFIGATVAAAGRQASTGSPQRRS